MSAYTCEVCKLDGGWHYPEEGEPFRCPNRAQTEAEQSAQELAKLAHENAWAAAQQILRDAADTRAVFTANDLEDEFDQIPSTLHGSAFTWAAQKGLIEPTGRMVAHRDPRVRHKIAEWRSLSYGRRAS